MTIKHQQGFLFFLPSEVVNIILSYIDQRDSLTCLSVCRDWYSLIPQYMESVWKTVRFSVYHDSNTNLYPHRSFGKYVKTVICHQCTEDKLYATLEKLITIGCTDVKSIELTKCYTVDQDTFLYLLKQLAPGLIRLELEEHMSNVALHHLLGVSSKLTYFVYRPFYAAYDNYNVYDQEPTVLHPELAHEFGNLSYLCLDVLIDKRLRLEPIFKKCPNLRVFIGASLRTSNKARTPESPYINNAIDFDVLLSSCPKLTHLAVNSSYCSIQDLRENNLQLEVALNTEDRYGLRTIYMCDEYGSDQATLLLTRSQGTLQVLTLDKGMTSLSSRGFSWSPIFESVRMSQLRTLICGEGVQICATGVVTLLNHSPLLDTLILDSGQPVVFDLSIIRRLQPAKMLRTFKCYHLQIDDEFDALALFERLPILESLLIWKSSLVFNLPRIIHCLERLKSLNLFQVDMKWKDEYMPTGLVANNSKLESVTLDGRGGTRFDLLQLFAPITTLKHLAVTSDAPSWTDSTDALRGFAETIDGKNLETLQLFGIRRVPFILLSTLGELRNLHTLAINGPYDDNFKMMATSVPVHGLLQLLEKSISLKVVLFSQLTLENDQRTYTRQEAITFFKQKAPSYVFEAYLLDRDNNAEVSPGGDVLQNVCISPM